MMYLHWFNHWLVTNLTSKSHFTYYIWGVWFQSDMQGWFNIKYIIWSANTLFVTNPFPQVSHINFFWHLISFSDWNQIKTSFRWARMLTISLILQIGIRFFGSESQMIKFLEIIFFSGTNITFRSVLSFYTFFMWI